MLFHSSLALGKPTMPFFNYRAALCAAVSILCLSTARAAVPVPVTVTIPPPPVAPRGLAFADEVFGRHLVYDTHAAYRRAGGVTFTARWFGALGGSGETTTPSKSGTETFRGENGLRKLSLATETVGMNGAREVRHTISNGITLVTTRFAMDQPAGAATRTFLRLTLDDEADMARALAQIQVVPATHAATWAVDPDVYLASADALFFHAGGERLAGGTRGEFVDQIETPNPDDRARRRAGRYLIDPDTHRLLRFEQWEIDTGRPRPARVTRRRNADGTRGAVITTPAAGETIYYRREEYRDVVVSKTALAGVAYATAVPPTYQEQALPSVDLPPLPVPLAPGAYDPRALGLVKRWRDAWDRYVSLRTDIEVTDRAQPRTAESPTLRARQQDTAVAFGVVLRRPDRARVALRTIEGPMRRGLPRDAVAVWDGDQLTVVVDGGRRVRPLRDSSALFGELNRAGLRDPFNALGSLLNPPFTARYFDKVIYDGPSLLDGREPVEGITLTREAGTRNGTRDTDTTIQILFGADGLPRLTLTRMLIKLNGRLERDQPPTFLIEVRYRNLMLDNEPATADFARP